MILCLDVGNTQIYAGVFDGEEIKLRFRYTSKHGASSDQLGIFFKRALRENNISTESIKKIAICSVVPSLDYSLRSACLKYFNIEPFILDANNPNLGITINYHNPQEVGADKLANAIAATKLYPNENIIIVDFGTATTCCAIDANKNYLGGIILPGMHLSMDALQSNTAKLPPVEIIHPTFTLGLSPSESIQAGLYYGQLGAIKEVIQRLEQDIFTNKQPLIIATGGFAHLFKEEKLFNILIPDLVLFGVKSV